ncbi:lysozyme inhibitor LprI family protein [Undibacterium fentianense]|uniref:DUF1311 domain-containing protein n=1 Tax=Undibacterium fentianense TaxID=2828728 RepID=A0A941ICF0_9BURK|nr:lysozyme inhibitor LprI family protein [Undibacterium fentianense]MBR7800119.1 DUF1311 domain-containing protein [Undibacterium fentianense]
MKNLIFILFALSAGMVEAASFNCLLAKTVVEKMICANPTISKADESLFSLYGSIKREARYPNDLIKDQIAWLKKRDACATDVCLIEKYQSRESELNDWPQKEAEKTKAIENCTDRPECWPEGSAMHTGLTLVATLQKTSAQLRSKHLELIDLLTQSPDYNGEKYPDSRVIAALEAQQISWEKYRSDECELIGSLTGAGGSWPSTYANRCEVNLTETRLRRITSAIRCIQKIPLENRWMEQAACLQQLAPLANKL